MTKGTNPNYWTVKTNKVAMGKATLANNTQQVIVDNGMSFAQAPKHTFVEIVKNVYLNHGIACFEMRPVWGCDCTK